MYFSYELLLLFYKCLIGILLQLVQMILHLLLLLLHLCKKSHHIVHMCLFLFLSILFRFQDLVVLDFCQWLLLNSQILFHYQLFFLLGLCFLYSCISILYLVHLLDYIYSLLNQDLLCLYIQDNFQCLELYLAYHPEHYFLLLLVLGHLFLDIAIRN